MPWRDPDAAPAGAVTTVELFFDLVFVFTLTQLTRVLEAGASLLAVGQVLLLFSTLWWMYGGYVWLANHVPPRRASQKLLLFFGMAGFLMAAIAVPRAFAGAGLVFGAGYLLVMVVHLLLFTQSDATAGVRRLAPYNLGAAALVLAAGLVAAPAAYALWTGAFLLMAVVPYLVPRWSWVGAASSFHVTVEHFAERHSLLVIVALGESVVAIGMGLDVDHFSAATVAVILLALALPGAFWWAYFTDSDAAGHALGRAAGDARSRLAVQAYFFAYIPILLGIVAAAAGIHAAIAHPGDPASWPSSLFLAGGVAAFLAGLAWVRASLGFASPASRLATALAVLATVPIGPAAIGGLHLTIVLAILIGMLLLDGRHRA